MHRFAGDVAVDEGLGEAFGEVGRPFQGTEPGREGDRAGSLRSERDPYVPSPDLVTGPLDEEPATGAARRVK